MEGETNILNMASRQNQILRARGAGKQERPRAKRVGTKETQRKGVKKGSERMKYWI